MRLDRHISWQLVGLLLALAVLPAVGGAKAALAATTIPVDCTADSGALAVALAAASDGDTLAIQGTCKGSFEVAHSLTVTGTGGATLDGQGAGPVLTIDPGHTVSVSDVSITGGFAFVGAGIFNRGTLTMTGSTVSGNTTSFAGAGGGIVNGASSSLTVANSTISDNSSDSGAAIYNFGLVTLSGSTISGNSGSNVLLNNSGGSVALQASSLTGNAGRPLTNGDGGTVTAIDISIDGNTGLGPGGGVFNQGTMTLTDSTVSGNTTPYDGGGIVNVGTLALTGSTVRDNSAPGIGGGIVNGGALTLTNSTLSGNEASSGGAIYAGFTSTMTLSYVMVSGNSASSGGGIFGGGTSTLQASIVAAQAAGGNCAGTIAVDDGYNLEDGSSCGFSAVTSLSNANPMLDPAGLKNNGGPTETIALLPASPAIDAIPSAVNDCGTTVTTDQRGVTRPEGAGCDVGAFERVVPAITVAIDIKPGGFPNAINPASAGTTPVAVLSSPGFNAPSQVDITSLKFGRTGNESSLTSCAAAQDVNRDSLLDVLCHFTTRKTGFQNGDTQGVLTGKTRGGTPISGSDSVVIVPST